MSAAWYISGCFGLLDFLFKGLVTDSESKRYRLFLFPMKMLISLGGFLFILKKKARYVNPCKYTAVLLKFPCVFIHTICAGVNGP